jgi:L-seryl-tRNA(Ser) seleniumtransferase
MGANAHLKKLPSVERILEDPRVAGRIGLLSRKGITRIVRETVEAFRERLAKGEMAASSDDNVRASVTDEAVRRFEEIERGAQRRVINATGVILHTNIGRAPLGEGARRAIEQAAAGYIDLEIDLESGARTERERRVSRLLALLADAEDAHVVNNNAAAMLLAVETLAGDGAVAVSRGELVEIGGSFRLPEILAHAAGRVIEIGTTNRTHRKDYEKAIKDGATLLLKVHTSNYRIVGYTNEVPVRELVEIGRRRGVPVMYDQGSGVLYPLAAKGIEGEESLHDVMASGVDLMSFSMDKVLGGPQGGAIVGRADLVARMRENHLSRALRLDKLTLAALESVLLDYWTGRFDEVPALRMITTDLEAVRSRAGAIASRVGERCPAGLEVTIEETESSIGGGSFPSNPLRSVVVQITLLGSRAEKTAARLRAGSPAVLVRVKEQSIMIDPRTVLPGEEDALVERLVEAFGALCRRE